jgi:D-glutamate cyclase
VISTAAEPHVAQIGELLDRLMTLDIRPKGRHGVLPKLYEAARERAGGPLSLAAAALLERAATRGSTVILTTGAGHPDFLPSGETDGPPGIVAIAAVLSIGMGAVPVLVTEAEFVDNLRTTALAGGLGVRDYEVACRVPFTCSVVPFPCDDTAERVAQEYISRFSPVALVSCEKIGPNLEGVAHYASGVAMAPGRARVEALFDLAADARIPSVGIGDNGNEIGCGLILDAVRQHKAHGRVCRCPCGGGLATRVPTDVLVMGNNSNWAAYAVAACLAALVGRPDLIRDPETELRVLEGCAMSGAADGANGRATDSVDGTPGAVSASMQLLMRTVVTLCAAEPYQRPF